MNNSVTEYFTPPESKFMAKGHFIVINDSLPEGVVIENPPNIVFQSPGKRNCDADKTLTVFDRKLRLTLGIGGLVFVIFVFLFLMQTDSRPERKAYQALKPKTVTEVKTLPINEMTVLETHSKDDPPGKSGIFGSRHVKIGDKVSNQGPNASQYVNSDGRERNFNTPLVIVADSGKMNSMGLSFSGERLSLPPNTYAHVYLEQELMTGNLTAPLSAVVYLDVKSGNKVLIPRDSRLIGQCQSVNGNRITIRFDRVMLANGREFAINGQALGDDNLVGVAGDVNHNITRKTGNMFASSLLDATSKTLNLTGNSFGTIFAGSMADQTSNSLENALDDNLSASGATIHVGASTRFKIVFE